jgi:hypothetical protein
MENESLYLLRGKQLVWARLAWIVVVLPLFGIVLASWPPYIRLLLTVCNSCEITATYAETLQANGISVVQWAIFAIIPKIIVFIGWMGMGSLIFLLKSNDRRALLLSALLIITGANFSGTIGYLGNYLPAWVGVSNIIGAVSFPSFLALIYLFPNGEFKPRWLVWLFGIASILFIPIQFDNLNFPIFYNIVFALAFVASAIVVPVYRYRRVMTFTERQQTKLVVFGIVLAMTGIATTITLVMTSPGACDTRNLYCDVVQNIGYNFSPLMIPIFIGIGILRSRLWDIDVVVRRTLQYSLITGLLAMTYFGGVTLFQRILTPLTGQTNSSLVTVITTLGIVVLFNPLRNRIQDLIDRRFYRKKYDAQQVLARFMLTARDETDLDLLTDRLAQVVQETMEPQQVNVWLRDRFKSGD